MCFSIILTGTWHDYHVPWGYKCFHFYLVFLRCNVIQRKFKKNLAEKYKEYINLCYDPALEKFNDALTVMIDNQTYGHT